MNPPRGVIEGGEKEQVQVKIGIIHPAEKERQKREKRDVADCHPGQRVWNKAATEEAGSEKSGAGM